MITPRSWVLSQTSGSKTEKLFSNTSKGVSVNTSNNILIACRRMIITRIHKLMKMKKILKKTQIIRIPKTTILRTQALTSIEVVPIMITLCVLIAKLSLWNNRVFMNSGNNSNSNNTIIWEKQTIRISKWMTPWWMKLYRKIWILLKV